MIPLYPQNPQQLQAQGLLDFGLRMMAGSGPTRMPMSLGAQMGQAGLGTMGAMRQAGAQMTQDQYRQALMLQMLNKSKREQELAKARGETVQSLDKAMEGPLQPGQQAAYDVLRGHASTGQPIPKHIWESVFPGQQTMKAPTMRTRYEGTKAIQEEYVNGTWRPVGSGPRFKPGGDKPNQLKSGDEGYMWRLAGPDFGVQIDYETMEITGGTPEAIDKARNVVARASRIYQDGLSGKTKFVTRSEAYNRAAREVEEERTRGNNNPFEVNKPQLPQL